MIAKRPSEGGGLSRSPFSPDRPFRAVCGAARSCAPSFLRSLRALPLAPCLLPLASASSCPLRLASAASCERFPRLFAFTFAFRAPRASCWRKGQALQAILPRRWRWRSKRSNGPVPRFRCLRPPGTRWRCLQGPMMSRCRTGWRSCRRSRFLVTKRLMGQAVMPCQMG